MRHAEALGFIACLREWLGKSDLPPEREIVPSVVTLDGARRMTVVGWMAELRCTKQAVSDRLKRIQDRIERGDPNPYRYEPKRRGDKRSLHP